jgi:hypothetical protein
LNNDILYILPDNFHMPVMVSKINALLLTHGHELCEEYDFIMNWRFNCNKQYNDIPIIISTLEKLKNI